ncbi:hypothetical protein [Nocardia sp. NBC_00416]|uniref:hypothetical protein n=1 Tax=Nocardia sp. NBC_00416 TaxID=2975991 RepID=UPI002E1F6FAF
MIVLPVDEVEGWVAEWRRMYRPNALRRGMQLKEITQSFRSADAVALNMTWEISGIYEFYAMRAAAAADTEVARFWTMTDAKALHRKRVVAQQIEKG